MTMKLILATVLCLSIVAAVVGTPAQTLLPKECQQWTAKEQLLVDGLPKFINLAEIVMAQYSAVSNVDADCFISYKLATVSDRILAISSTHLQQWQDFISIYDGVIPVASAKLSLDEMKVLSKSRKDLPSTIYTTGHTAIIRIHLGKLIAASKTSQFLNSAPFQLKITKAVTCPASLDGTSVCARAVDTESCYCAESFMDTWSGQDAFCKYNTFSLLSLESLEEENALYQAFISPDDGSYWMSLSDNTEEGVYVWEANGSNLYPWAGGVGYANWDKANPTGAGDCAFINGTAWVDSKCSELHAAICEKQP